MSASKVESIHSEDTEGASRPSLGEIFVRDRIITQSQLRAAHATQKQTARSLGRVLVDSGYITEAMRMAVLQKSFGFDLISLKDIDLDPAVLGLIPGSFAEKHSILPIRQEAGSRLVVAMEDPSDLVVADAIKNQVGMRVKAFIAGSEELRDTIRKQYSKVTKGKEERAAPRRRGMLFRVVRYSAFPILCFAPLAAFFLLMVLYRPFYQALSRLTGFDIGLYTLLGWGLWSIVLFEINGLVFHSSDEEDEEDSLGA